MSRSSKNSRTKRPCNHQYIYDPWIVVPALALVFCGLLMVASASLAVSVKDFGSPFHFFLHQFVYVMIGAVLVIGSSKISLAKWQALAPVLLLLTAIGLILVLIPGIGKHINGAKRWIGLGFFHLQVSEFAKLAMMIYSASYLTRRYEDLHTGVWGFIKPLLVLGVIAVLLLLEPDFGATTVIVLVTMGMMFLAGAPLRKYSVLVAVAVLMLASLVYFAPYRVERVLNFLDPWNNAYNGGYQLTQALMAFGRGGLLGVGLGNSVQKLFYLPEAHTDFLFAVIGEELGFVGCMVVISLYVILIARILYVARQCLYQESVFAAYLAYGLALWLAAQSFINIGVNVGILPTKGLTLPFISYGGSSLLVSSIALGLLLRIAQEAKQPTMKRGVTKGPLGRPQRKRRQKRSATYGKV